MLNIYFSLHFSAIDCIAVFPLSSPLLPHISIIEKYLSGEAWVKLVYALPLIATYFKSCK